MSSSTRKFILKICILTFIIAAFSIVLFSTLLRDYYFKTFPLVVVLIAVVTTIGHLWVIRASNQNTLKFTTAFMGSTTLKLIIYLFFMLISLWIDHSQTISFVLTFILLYILFTVFEVLEILRHIKK